MNFKKSSSHELVVQILIFDLKHPWDMVCKVVHKNKIHPKMAPLGVLHFT